MFYTSAASSAIEKITSDEIFNGSDIYCHMGSGKCFYGKISIGITSLFQGKPMFFAHFFPSGVSCK